MHSRSNIKAKGSEKCVFLNLKFKPYVRTVIIMSCVRLVGSAILGDFVPTSDRTTACK